MKECRDHFVNGIGIVVQRIPLLLAHEKPVGREDETVGQGHERLPPTVVNQTHDAEVTIGFGVPVSFDFDLIPRSRPPGDLSHRGLAYQADKIDVSPLAVRGEMPTQGLQCLNLVHGCSRCGPYNMNLD